MRHRLGVLRGLAVLRAQARPAARRLFFPFAAALGVTGVVVAAGVGLAAAGQRPAPATQESPAAAVRAGAGSPAAAGGATREEEPAVPLHPTVVSAGPSRVGPVLVDGASLTLYVFSADRPGLSACAGACARTWLPVLSHGGKPQGGSSVPAGMIGSIERAEGTYQVTAWRRPLYYYVGDHAPGDASGHGRVQFGGSWQAATPQEK
jgi:predicted lipoprotein with Yx(FWY)xxD motif